MCLSKRFLLILSLIGLTGAAGVFAVQAEGLHGATLGFIQNTDGTVIWPILGITGASALGDRIVFDGAIRGAVISPKQDYAMAVRSEDGQIVVIRLADELPTSNVIPGIERGAEAIAISPTGSAAAIHNRGLGIVQVIGSPQSTAELIYQFDTSRVPGRLTELAVSDDGTITLAKFADADTTVLWGFDSAGSSWQVAIDRPSGAAFFPNRHDAVIAENATQNLFVISDVAQTAIRVPLISAMEGVSNFSTVSVSGDSTKVFAADNTTGSVVIVDMGSRIPTVTPCQCSLTGLSRLKGSSIFSLTKASGEAMTMLDASSANARIVVVPPESSIGHDVVVSER